MGGENVSEGENELVKRQNERQMMKLKILLLFHISAIHSTKLSYIYNVSFYRIN